MADDDGDIIENEGEIDKDIGGNNLINFGSVHPNRENSKFDLRKMQSIIDPSQEKALYNYNLDDFKNSIWENFLGSHVQINKLEEADGTSKVTGKIVNKMGPV